MPRKRNIIFFNAGLGNQLFQFSFAHLLTKKNQGKVQYFYDEFHRPDRPFELQGLIEKCDHLIRIGGGPGNIAMLYRRFINRLYRFKYVQRFISEEKSNILGVEVNPFKDREVQRSFFAPRLRMGYFQHWKLVEKSWELFSSELLNYIDDISLGKLNFELNTCILLHVRRGDLVNQLDSMGALSVDYYRSAIRQITNFDKKVLVVVTDDVTGASDIVKSLNPQFVIGPNDLNPWQTLKLMSLCNSFVCANSTLSWWGAYLSIKQNPLSQCVIPSPWLKNWPQPVGEAFEFPEFTKNDSVFLQNIKIPTDFKYTS